MSDPLEPVDIAQMKLPDLKRELKSRGLKVSGTKSELFERLQMAMMDPNESDLLGEAGDLLAGDDEKEEDDETVSEGVGGNVVVDTNENGSAKMAAESTPVKPAKKVSIDRDVVLPPVDDPIDKNVGVKPTPISLDIPSTPPTETKVVGAPVSPPIEKALASPTEAKTTDKEQQSDAERAKARADKFGIPSSDQTRAEARADKFGIPASDKTRKANRAERFGLPVKGGGGGGPGGEGKGAAPKAKTGENFEALKKRSERFGTTTSKSLAKAADEERIRKRQERFGVVSKHEPKPKKVADNLNGGTNSVVLDEKLKKRSERFGGGGGGGGGSVAATNA